MRIKSLTEKLAKEYASWEYPKPYDIYNLPEWDIMKASKYSVTTTIGRKQCYAFVQDNILMAVVSFKEKESAIYSGIALNPSFCGKGNGYKILTKAISYYDKKHTRTKPFCAEVRAWNIRSIKTCEKSGFVALHTSICKGKDGDFEGVYLEHK